MKSSQFNPKIVAEGNLNLIPTARFSMDDLRIYEEIIRHIWLNSHLSNRGYDSLTDEHKLVFNSIVGEKPSDRNA